jgi:hypothetical protein
MSAMATNFELRGWARGASTRPDIDWTGELHTRDARQRELWRRRPDSTVSSGWEAPQTVRTAPTIKPRKPNTACGIFPLFRHHARAFHPISALWIYRNQSQRCGWKLGVTQWPPAEECLIDPEVTFLLRTDVEAAIPLCVHVEKPILAHHDIESERELRLEKVGPVEEEQSGAGVSVCQ